MWLLVEESTLIILKAPGFELQQHEKKNPPNLQPGPEAHTPVILVLEMGR